MDKEKARQKEAERTLKRIKGTLRHLEDGSAWEDPVTENEEFQRMKKLVESGYSHNNTGKFTGLTEKLNAIIKHPAFLALMAIAVLIIVELLQR